MPTTGNFSQHFNGAAYKNTFCDAAINWQITICIQFRTRLPQLKRT